MRHNFLMLFSLSVPSVVFLIALAGLPARGQSDPKACRKPPKILSQPKPPEYRENGKKRKAQGKVAITIDEDGHVSEAKVLEASPKEAGDALLATAKTITFLPRPGCGTFKTEMVFVLNQ
ncbi:MAG TPA: TonB family protein [Candidatus Acidoferrum sp.]|nr:TonB family protein [Candidatus Acidoferrum sp.]